MAIINKTTTNAGKDAGQETESLYTVLLGM
jgi:hypothetical protein